MIYIESAIVSDLVWVITPKGKYANVLWKSFKKYQNPDEWTKISRLVLNNYFFIQSAIAPYSQGDVLLVFFD